MAIQFARARYISRSTGGSAVRSAAYNAREAITAERTGELYYFRHRDAPEHHEVLLPEGAAERFRESGVLWNAAEAAERRKDAQVAREIVLALPANTEVTTEDRIAMARSFAEEHFVAKGLAVQLDVHAPHGAEAESERANWHAHLLITTRRIERDGLAAKKARDLDPEVRSAGGRARVADGAVWGELWREHQDRYFCEHGIEARVDPRATLSQEHIGPVRMRRAGSEIVERAEAIRQANEAAARDPEQVLATLTRNNATFTGRDLDRYLVKHLDTEAERAAVKRKVVEHQGLLTLHDRETGEAVGRFTTRAVREQERTALADGAGLAKARSAAVPSNIAEVVQDGRRLRADQRAAFAHAATAGGLAIIEGRAGTGKSYTLAAIHDAHALDGRRVVGLAPTNTVAQDLAASGFEEARTVHAALFALKNGRDQWNARTVVVVDEAAMLDARITGELLAAARQAGAKLLLAGDDRQLASIERGGLFTALKQRHGAVEISEVTRQSVDWQRQAARDLAEGRFAEAVAAYDKAGAITWTDKQEEARSALVAAWTRDAEARPNASRFVFAYTNRDVDALNAELRQVRGERGELIGSDVRLETKHGAADFAVGDRVQFTDTDKKRHIYNGNVGTITGLDTRTGQITATLDTAGGAGREVTFSPADFQGFRHGYAGTIYKGQGKTLDHTYLYHTEHWRSAASYVALTRQRESAEVFVARETARDAGQLARQMARGEVRAASVAWATREELAERQASRGEVATRQAPEQEAEAPTPTAKRGKFAGLKLDGRGSAAGRGAADRAPEREERTPTERERAVERVAAFLKAERTRASPAREEDPLRRKVREALTAQQRLNTKSKSEEVQEKLPPAGRAARTAGAFWDSTAAHAVPKLDAAPLAAKEAREGPVTLPGAERQAAGRGVPERAARALAPLLSAWRDPTGRGRDSLGRSTSPAELARVAGQAPAAVREIEAQKSSLRGAYRDPELAADMLDKLIKKSGHDLRAAARVLERDGPEVLGTLRGREGWLASRVAQAERWRARNAGAAIIGSLEREAAARDTAVRHHTTEVEQQRARDTVEVPDLSKAALNTLKDVQFALRATQSPREGERYDARERRQEEAVARAWIGGRVDPQVAGELDRFLAAAERRLGEAGLHDASRAAHGGRSMTVPGAGREHQAELDALAGRVTLGRQAVQHCAAWGQRIIREAEAAERERARAEERQRLGLPPEPPRERLRQTRGLGLER